MEVRGVAGEEGAASWAASGTLVATTSPAPVVSTNSRREILLISPPVKIPLFILCLAAAFHDFQERSTAQFVDGEPGCRRFLLRESAAIQAAQQEIEQALAGGGIVEHVAHQSGLGGLTDKVSQAGGSRIKALQKKRKDRGIARGKLAGMQIPALVITVRERALHQIEMRAHGPLDNGAILRLVLFVRRRAMPRNGQDGAGAIGKKHAAVGRAHLYDVTREIARRMIQT